MDTLSMSVSNQSMEAVAPSSFGTAGAPTQASPEKVTPSMPSALSGKAAEAAPAMHETEMIGAYWASFGDDATRAQLRKRKTQPVMEVVIGTDDRRIVGNFKDYPWRCIASLRITAKDGTSWLGTGWLVNRRVLLTAGHCVYMADHGGWPQQIEVIPGRDGDTFPFGSCNAAAFRSVNGWVNDGNRDYDYGAILLPENCAYGDQLGWFGYQVRDDDNLKSVTVNISGYPGELPQGTLIPGRQWFLSGPVKTAETFEFEYDIDTTGGQSGSPVWIMLDDGVRYGVGIHTDGSSAGNSATRITQEVFDNVTNWIKEAP
jgi:V8-like Glu-specific endopeptidase